MTKKQLTDYLLLILSSKFNRIGNEYPKVIKGDSWFGSVKAAAALAEEGIEAVLQIKTGHSLFPKDFISKMLEGCPGGVHLVLKGRHPNGATLYSLGYRYSSSKTLFFVMTDGAGSTSAGTSYERKFVDVHGNIGKSSIVIF